MAQIDYEANHSAMVQSDISIKVEEICIKNVKFKKDWERCTEADLQNASAIKTLIDLFSRLLSLS